MDLYLDNILDDLFFGLTPFERGIVGASIYGFPIGIIFGLPAVICVMPLILFEVVCSAFPLTGLITSMPFCCLPTLMLFLCIGIISEFLGGIGTIALSIGGIMGAYKGLTHNLVEQLADFMYNLIIT